MSANTMLLDGLKQVFNTMAEFISPLHCHICSKKINKNNYKYFFLCLDCYAEMPPPPSPDYVTNKLISNISKDNLAITNAFSLFSLHENFKFINLIHSLKYYGFRKIGTELGLELGKIIGNYDKTDYNFVIPVPIHSARIRERGFNQSKIIAEGIGVEISTSVNDKIIKRNKYTETQTLLSADERMTNVANVFVAGSKKKLINKSRILLVDDVLTTGSTINSAANCLLDWGASRVDCATLAVA